MMDESRQAVSSMKVQDREVPPLKQLYAYLTDGCNLSCRHCWLDPYTMSEKRKYRFLSAGLFEKAVGEERTSVFRRSS
jgi:molybdenum cofactor biosynthesis enzyme MoaA